MWCWEQKARIKIKNLIYRSSKYMVTEIRTVSAVAENVPTGKGHEKTFWCDGNVLCFNSNVGFLGVYICQSWLAHVHFTVSHLYFNNKCKTELVSGVQSNYRDMLEHRSTSSGATNISRWKAWVKAEISKIQKKSEFPTTGQWTDFS